MFDDNGRVKAIKLRGEISEGFILPITVLENYIVSVTNKELENVKEGVEFDAVSDNDKEFWISKKYLPKRTYTQGTSGISAYVLCKQPLNWKQKIAKWLTGYEFNKYDYIYASRTVIKNEYYNQNVGGGYYGVDVWAEADKVVRPCLAKGMTAYYEIVGYLPNGGCIQKKYDYGCVPPKEGEVYTPEKHFKVRIYRVTYTNTDGKVFEFTPHQVQQWCATVGLTPVEECYCGLAKDLYPDLDPANHWS